MTSWKSTQLTQVTAGCLGLFSDFEAAFVVCRPPYTVNRWAQSSLTARAGCIVSSEWELLDFYHTNTQHFIYLLELCKCLQSHHIEYYLFTHPALRNNSILFIFFLGVNICILTQMLHKTAVIICHRTWRTNAIVTHRDMSWLKCHPVAIPVWSACITGHEFTHAFTSDFMRKKCMHGPHFIRKTWSLLLTVNLIF